jgi:stage II sporulation protein AA (anti-sigma F factor antagonist)
VTVVDISTAPAPRGHVVAVAGEIDMSTVPGLRSCLRELDGDLTLDCTDVTFIDSVGIELFIETHQRLQRSGARFAVANLQHACRRILELMKLDEVLILQG